MPELDILLQGHRWTVINKPAGIAVERHEPYDTVEGRALRQFKRARATKAPYIGIVHRLDRPTSGCLLLAHNKSTLVALQRQIEKRLVRKKYWALVSASTPIQTGKLVHFLYRDSTRRMALTSPDPLPSAKRAELDIIQVHTHSGYHLLEIGLHTGRFHQIRAQLAAIGHPVVGDRLYSSRHPWSPHQIALHAGQLQFIDPHQQADDIAPLVTATAPLPPHWPTADGWPA